MVVTEFGIFRVVKTIQPIKASSPMVMTEFPIVKDDKLLQLLKA